MDVHRSSGNRRTRVAEPAPSRVLVPNPTPWLNGSDEWNVPFEEDAELCNTGVLLAFLSSLFRFAADFAAAPAGSSASPTDDSGMENRIWRSWCGCFTFASSSMSGFCFSFTRMTLSAFEFFSAA